MKRVIVGTLVLCGAILLGGCPPEDYERRVPTTLDEINRIIDDSSLDPQETREALAALGLTPSTINALLTDIRQANQYGGTPRSAYLKVAGDRLLELTPDEVQIYGDHASEADADLNLELSDEEAQAIVDFFNDYGISSRDKLAAYLDTTGTTVPSAIPDGVLDGLFVDFDPDVLLPNLP